MTNIHPFFQPLDELTIDELDKKYADLMGKWRAARGMHMGPDVMHQLDLMLSTIEGEKEKRLTADDKPDGVVIDTDPIKDLPNVPAYPSQKIPKKD